MEDIRIYDFEFNLLHIEHDIASCNWKLYDNEIGTFEMHFPISSDLTGIAMQKSYLVAVQGSKQAIITGRQMGDEGVLYGRTCNWILTRFCTSEQFDTDSLLEDGTIAAKDAQTICEYIIGKTMSGVSDFVFEENTADTFGDSYAENKGVTSAFDLIQNCLSRDGAGHRVFFDIPNKRWVFRAVKGKTLSVILSEANRNAYETEYSEDMQDYFDGGWYEQEMQDMGDWDASANSPKLVVNQADNFAKAYRVTTAGTRFGISFAEGDYIVCEDKGGAWKKADRISDFWVHLASSLNGIYAWETSLSGSYEEEAKRNLSECAVEKTAKVKTRSLLYGRDYELGDSVRTEIKKGSFQTAVIRKITGVHLWYEDNDIGEQPIMEG